MTNPLDSNQRLYRYPIFSMGEMVVFPEKGVLKEDPKALFKPAVRHNNKKRSFLFVSKILGKHIPIQPSALRKACQQLACIYAKRAHLGSTLPLMPSERVLVIGFAETATAMGHCFFDCFGKNATYIHSTRERFKEVPNLLQFEESHSHATQHNFYLRNKSLLFEAKNIIIVDDEITTGNTVLNLIKALNSLAPNKRYTIVSFLDWRSNQDQNRFAGLEKSGISIDFISLLQGKFTINKKSDMRVSDPCWTFASPPSHEIEWQEHHLGFPVKKIDERWCLLGCARFGVDEKLRNDLEENIKEACAYLKSQRKGDRVLCLGIGEFMYIPLRLAEGLGENTYFSATTKSPIMPYNQPNYGVQTGFKFPCPQSPAFDQFLYNIHPRKYDEVFLFLEMSLPKVNLLPLLGHLYNKGFRYRHIVIVGR